MKRRVALAALVMLGALAAGKSFSASQTVLIAAFNYLPGQSDVVLAAGAGIGGTDVLPDTLTVTAGDDLSVTNVDPVPHTITSDDVDPITQAPLFDTANIGLLGSKTVSTAGLTAGTYPFHCTVHPFMHGKLVVQ